MDRRRQDGMGGGEGYKFEIPVYMQLNFGTMELKEYIYYKRIWKKIVLIIEHGYRRSDSNNFLCTKSAMHLEYC